MQCFKNSLREGDICVVLFSPFKLSLAFTSIAFVAECKSLVNLERLKLASFTFCRQFCISSSCAIKPPWLNSRSIVITIRKSLLIKLTHTMTRTQRRNAKHATFKEKPGCICRICRVCRKKKFHRTDRIHSISYNKLYLSFLLY